MDARLREGIRLFNRGRFFESHETLEQFYLESDNEHKPFVEGLVQLATAFRILRDFGEVKGPVRMIYQALIRFENYQPIYLEIRVKELIESMEAWAKSAETGGSKIRTAIPKITLAASAFSFDD
jgi:predicted metal-dependent hydrolase